MTEKLHNLFLQAKECHDKKDWDGVIRCSSQIIDLPEDQVSKEYRALALNNRGLAFVNNGEFDRAIRDFENALEIKSEDAETLNNRGFAFAKKEEFERAISDFDDAIRIQPGLADAHHNRAIALARIHARETEAKYKNEYGAQLRQIKESHEQVLRQVTDPGEILALYAPGEKEYRHQIEILTPKIEEQKNLVFRILKTGFIAIFAGVGVLSLVSGEVSFATLFVIAPLTLAWIAVCFPLINHLLGLRKEKRLLQVCVEDYFRKQTLARYTLAAEGEHRQRLIAITHAHFATRSAAEFLAGWKPESEENPNPLTDAIDKAIRGVKDAASSKSTEKSPS